MGAFASHVVLLRRRQVAIGATTSLGQTWPTIMSLA